MKTRDVELYYYGFALVLALVVVLFGFGLAPLAMFIVLFGGTLLGTYVVFRYLGAFEE